MTNIQCDFVSEPLESDRKPEDALSEYTPVRLQTLLKYFRINPGFLRHPVNYPRTLNLIANDLREPSFQKSCVDILDAIEEWKARVALETEPTLPPDRELKRLLVALESRLTHAQITLILQHMEVVGGDADGLWATIAVEMRALKHPPRPEIYWRRGFEEWCQEAKERFREDPDALTALQQRYIDYARERGELDDGSGVEFDALELVLNHCRTCLGVLKAADPKAYLFEPGGTGTTLADKINVCFGTGIDLEERLPKYVCWKCVEKVEGAYALKMQIDRTDEELKCLIGEYGKRERRQSEHVKHEQREEEAALEMVQEEPEEQQEEEEALVASDKEVEHLEEVVEMENVKYSWQVVEDHEMVVEQVEHVDASELTQQEAECFDVMVATDEDYLEDDGQEAFVKEEPEKKIMTPCQKLSPQLTTKRKIVADLNDKFYHCPECRVVLRTQQLWEAHIASHNSEKRYTCEVCSKQFRSSSTLKIHQRTHTNERPYVCEICSKSFVQSTNLVYHMKVHRDIRNYPCDQCTYKARNKNDLNLHKRTHTGARPYVCEYCDCPFTTSSNLSKHIRRRHMGEKKYQCQECNKTFTTKETVQKHMVTHTGTKPYSCPECTSTYGWYNGLQKHMKAMHPGAPIPTEKTMMVASLGVESLGEA
ncbi:zinc finger protein 436 isoform X2 [Aedes aegypti]|uniref:Uncharacterized protein n=1 Tax=Aedes aegypti TaxID=7159 RepID=A0A6I8U341_AEDAE|nr:zinc finger protein 436 isoform X2 [Aedes aegypti]